MPRPTGPTARPASTPSCAPGAIVSAASASPAWMRAAGLAGVSRRKGACARRGAGREEARPAPDLVERNFTAERPDRLRVAAITHLPTWAGLLYLAVVLDAFSRRAVGWSMADHLRTQLVLDALAMAVRRRRPHDVIHHPDQGSRYTSIALGLRCREAGGRPSMGSRSATPVTPRRARPSSPRASASCSTAGASARRPRRAGPCSPSSRAGTTRAGGTRRSALSLARRVRRLSLARRVRKADPGRRLTPKLLPVHRTGATPDRPRP
jgi:hypothetical protein